MKTNPEKINQVLEEIKNNSRKFYENVEKREGIKLEKETILGKIIKLLNG